MNRVLSGTLAVLMALLIVASPVAGAASVVTVSTVSDPGNGAPLPGESQVVLDLRLQTQDALVNDHDGTDAAVGGDATGTFGTTAAYYDKDADASYTTGDEVIDDVGGSGTYSDGADTAVSRGTDTTIDASNGDSLTDVDESTYLAVDVDDDATLDAGTEDDVVTDDDGDSQYTAQADQVVDADGSTDGTGDWGAASDMTAGAVVTAYTATGSGTLYYADTDATSGFSANDEVYYDAADDGRDSGDTLISAGNDDSVATWGSATSFASGDNVAIQGGDSTYSDGEDIVIDYNDGGTYSAAADTVVNDEGSADRSAGDSLVSVGSTAHYDDADSSGTYNAGDEIYLDDDDDDAYTSQADAQYNAGEDGTFDVSVGDTLADLDESTYGYVDVDDSSSLTQGDEVYSEGDGGTLGSDDYGDDLNAITVENRGSLALSDLSSIEFVTLDGTGSVTSTVATSSSVSGSEHAFSGQTEDFADQHFGIRVTLASDAPEGETLHFAVPTLSDSGTADAYDSGDAGLYFAQNAASGDYANGADITIDGRSALDARGISFVDPNDNDHAKVELAFGSSIDAATTDTGDFTVYRDSGSTVAVNAVEDDDGDGRVVLDLGADVSSARLDVVNVSHQAVDSTGGTSVPGQNVTVTTTSTTVEEGDASTASSPTAAFTGEGVAMLSNELDESVEINGTESGFVASRSTGSGSQIHAFDTDGRTRQRFTASFQGSSTDESFVELRDLDFTASVNDTSVTDAEQFQVNVSATDSGRSVDVEVTDPNDDTTVYSPTLDSDGEATQVVSPDETGNYSIEVIDVDSGLSITTSEVAVSAAAEGSASLGSTVVEDDVGDVVNVTVSLSNADAAVVGIGDDDVGYRANVSVEDGNDDGEVVLQWNTFTATNASTATAAGFGVAHDDDAVTLVDSVPEYGTTDVDTTVSGGLGGSLDAGDYELRVAGGTTDPTANPDAVGSVTLEGRSTDGVDVWVAPHRLDGQLATAGDVYSNVEGGNVSQSSQVASGDLVIAQVRASGLEGLVETANADNATTTARFLSLTSRDAGIDFVVNQTNAAANSRPKVLAPNNVSTSVVEDSDNDTWFLVIDTGDANVYRESAAGSFGPDSTDATGQSIADGDAWQANFTVLQNRESLASNAQTATDDVTTESRSISLAREPYNVSNAANRTVEGQTTLAPGSEVTVRIQSTGDTDPKFLKIAEDVLVDGNRRFSAAFDFSEQQVNDTYEIRPRSAEFSGTSTTVEGTVVEAEATGTPGASIEGPTGTPTPTDGSTTTATATPTDEPTDAATATPTATPTDEPTDAETGTEQDTPGFGLAVALVALLAAALLAVRRD